MWKNKHKKRRIRYESGTALLRGIRWMRNSKWNIRANQQGQINKEMRELFNANSN